MAAYYGWQFHTKLELAAAQIEWLVQQLGPNRPPIWVVTDGAYAKRPFLKRVLAAGVTVISRLRCDAALWSLPVVVDPGQKRGRGRPPKYGKNRIDLAKRAAQTRGWQTGLFSLYGRLVVKKYKTFLATYKPVGGVIRVVLVREPDRWVAYFSTDPDLSVASILETVADRSALEQVFHDVKEVHGAGQQQLRHVWANVGAWNLIGWWHTLVELWAWDRPQSRLRDRSDSPWDKPERRPSHANRCQELRREALQEEYSSLPSVAGFFTKNPPVHSAPHAQGRMRLTVLGKCRQPQAPRNQLEWEASGSGGNQKCRRLATNASALVAGSVGHRLILTVPHSQEVDQLAWGLPASPAQTDSTPAVAFLITIPCGLRADTGSYSATRPLDGGKSPRLKRFRYVVTFSVLRTLMIWRKHR